MKKSAHNKTKWENIISFDSFLNDINLKIISSKIDWELNNIITLQCINGHIFNITPARLGSIKRCQQCFIESKKQKIKLSKNEINKKREETCLKKYGVKNVFQNKKIKEKIKSVWIQKYGTDNPAKNLNVNKKLQQTKRNNINYDDFFQYVINNNFVPLFTEDKFYDITETLQIKCEKCHTILTLDTPYKQLVRCSCKSRWRSKYEDEIYDFINSLNLKCTIIKNYKIQKREIDIYLPEYNLGIDFHGIYWHSECNVDKNYHLDKLNFMKNNNIRFIQIFQNEWELKRTIVKSLIKNIFN